MPEVGETELDKHALARTLLRWSWPLAILAILAAVGTYVGLGYVDPLYTADTRILIEERESPLTRQRDGSVDASSSFDESAIQSQVEVLRSREIAGAVIDKLDLTQRPEFDPARRPSLIRSLAVIFGFAENPADSTIRQRVMDSYFERLKVYPLQRSRVIGVEFAAPNPELAGEVANAVAEAFVLLQQDAKRQSAVAATLWLEQEIARLRERVAESEQAVADYRTNNDLFDVEQRGVELGDLSTQQLSDINAELARARAARAEAEARAELVQKMLDEGGPIDASEEVLNSQLIQRLRERQAALQAQTAELSTTLLPSHPRIRALQGQVANLEAQIREEAAKVLASLQTAARVAAAREQSLVASLDVAKVDVSRSNDQGIQLRALEREAGAQRELLETFLARYREAAARTDANYLPADARIISRAVPPTDPSFPRKAMMSIAAAFAVLLVGSALVVLGEFASGRAFRVIGYGLAAAPPEPGEAIKDGEDLVAAASEEADDADEAWPDAVPDDGTEAAAIADADTVEDEADAEDGSDAAEDEAEDDERPGTAGLADIIANEGVRVALFAGAEGGEGAGEIAYSTAKIAAADKVRCVLVDVGRTPAEVLGLEQPGLGDLLAGDAAFGEVIRRDDDVGVHVIQLGVLGEHAPLQRMQLVVGALSHTYDKVVIVADSLDDWPNEHVRPDIAAIVCRPETTEAQRTEVYDTALARGAKSAIIVRLGDGMSESEAA